MKLSRIKDILKQSRFTQTSVNLLIGSVLAVSATSAVASSDADKHDRKEAREEARQDKQGHRAERKEHRHAKHLASKEQRKERHAASKEEREARRAERKARRLERLATRPSEFIKVRGGKFRKHGKEVRFAGSNNYYLHYKSQYMVDQVLEDAAEQGFTVMRTWGSLEIGLEDGSESTSGKAEGAYFQYWDPETGAPAYNDGVDGLENLDYVVYKAQLLGLKLIIPLVNNWADFGGMEQYVAWADGEYHDDFYTNEQIKGWYKDWISHLLNRTNTYSGRKYNEDPTIMMWELANEPRCANWGAFPVSDTCTTDTITTWADEMSTHIRANTKHQMIAAGDEGFFCDPESDDWLDQCGEGVDTVALASLPNIDAMSMHLYPDAWGKDVEWGVDWIERHAAAAKAIKKPVYLGEFGVEDKATRNADYKLWTDTLYDSGVAGALYWILSAEDDTGALYPDYDNLTVYCPSPVCSAMSNLANSMTHRRQPLDYDPVADHDSANVEFAGTVSLDVNANDIAYSGALIDAASIDLDPTTDGQQTEFVATGGSFLADGNGSITFTAAADFDGDVTLEYTVDDGFGRVSNVATVTVTVQPDALAALSIVDFEESSSWSSSAFVVTSDWASEGSNSGEIVSFGGNWLAINFSSARDFSSKTSILWDIKTGPSGTSQELVLQTGSGWAWCQGSAWDWVNNDTETTMERTFDSLDCGGAELDLTQVHAIHFFMGNGGEDPVYIDNIRAE